MSTSPFGIEQLTALFRSESKDDKVLEQYISAFGPPKADLSHYPFHETLQEFTPFEFRIPEGLEDAFDWPLLIRFVGAVTWIDYKFEFPDDEELPVVLVTRDTMKGLITENVSTMRYREVCDLFYDLFRELLKDHIPDFDNGIFLIGDPPPPDAPAKHYRTLRVAAELETFRRRETNKLVGFLGRGQ